MALPLDKLNKLLRTAALGVEVVQTATKGRGIVATRAHRAGAAVVPAGEPLAHSSKRAVNAFAGHGDFSAYERAWRKARGKLEDNDGRRHPLLVAQIASRVANEPEASPYVLAVAALCSARMTGPTPAPWVAVHQSNCSPRVAIADSWRPRHRRDASASDLLIDFAQVG